MCRHGIDPVTGKCDECAEFEKMKELIKKLTKRVETLEARVTFLFKYKQTKDLILR